MDYHLRVNAFTAPHSARDPPYDRAAAYTAYCHLCGYRGNVMSPSITYEPRDDGRVWLAVYCPLIAVIGSLGPMGFLAAPAGSHVTLAVLPRDLTTDQVEAAAAAAVDILACWLVHANVSWVGRFLLHPRSPPPGGSRTPFLIIDRNTQLHHRFAELAEVAVAAAGLPLNGPWIPPDFHLRLGHR